MGPDFGIHGFDNGAAVRSPFPETEPFQKKKVARVLFGRVYLCCSSLFFLRFFMPFSKFL